MDTTTTQVAEQPTFWWQKKSVALIAATAAGLFVAWAVARSRVCGVSWPAAAARGLGASALSFAAAAFVAYHAFMFCYGISIRLAYSESDSKRSEWLFRILFGLPWAAFAGVAIGGIRLLTRCK